MLLQLICHAGYLACVIQFVKTRMRSTVNTHDLFAIQQIELANKIFGHFFHGKHHPSVIKSCPPSITSSVKYDCFANRSVQDTLKSFASREKLMTASVPGKTVSGHCI